MLSPASKYFSRSWIYLKGTSTDFLSSGVEYIHTQSIVHRDLKPSNVFLSTHRSSFVGSSLGGCVDTSKYELGLVVLNHIYLYTGASILLVPMDKTIT